MVQHELMEKNATAVTLPDCFPEGAPPEDATPVNGEYFRITNKRKPSKACFLTDYQKDPEDVLTRQGLVKVCSYGISLQNSIEGVRETVGRFRNATMKRYIAKAKLVPDVGVIKQTFDEGFHHTLWIYSGVELSPLFKCIEMVEPK